VQLPSGALLGEEGEMIDRDREREREREKAKRREREKRTPTSFLDVQRSCVQCVVIYHAF
jgi:hypothetical protein